MIDDITYNLFVDNSLSLAKMVEVENSLIKDREADSVIHSCIANYEINHEMADELLGEDNLSKIDDRIELSTDSERVDSTKNIQIMNNINFTQEEISKIQNLISRYNDSVDESMTIDENLAKFYLSNCPGTFPEDANDVVKSLHEGINQFNDRLRKALEDENFDFKQELSSITESMSLDQKYELYLNFLATLMTLNSNNFSSEQADEKESFQDIKGRLKSSESVTEEMVAEVERLIADQLLNNSLCIGTTESLKVIMTHLPKGEEEIEKIILGSEEDVKQKLIASMAAYIAYRNEELESLKGTQMDVEEIAVFISMSIEQNRILDELNEGNTTIDRVIKILKILGGVALISTLVIASGLIAASMTTLGFLAATAILGTSTFALIMATIFSFVVGVSTVKLVTEGSEEIVDWSSDKYDVMVDVWRTKFWPSIRESLHRCKEWLKEKLSSGSVAEEETSTSEAVEVQPVQ